MEVEHGVTNRVVLFNWTLSSIFKSFPCRHLRMNEGVWMIPLYSLIASEIANQRQSSWYFRGPLVVGSYLEMFMGPKKHGFTCSGTSLS